MQTTYQIALVLLLFISGTASAADNFPLSVARHLNKRGPIISTQSFHKTYPMKQIVVHYCVDENEKGGAWEGGNNPENVHCEIALFNKTKQNTWVFGDEVSVGQGTVQQFDNALVAGEAVTYAQSDAACCPSIKVKISFSTSGGKLAVVPQ